ncbi:hypothetical protein THAOC_14178, partial [Thalassiosira oceanica]
IRLMIGWEGSNDERSPPFVPEVFAVCFDQPSIPKCADTRAVLNRVCPPVRLSTVSTSCGLGPMKGSAD